MSNQNCMILSVILTVIGSIGVLKGLKDQKDSKDKKKFVFCPHKELKMRDNQYLFMSTVALVSGVALYLSVKKKESV
jgi:hypothetical protein